MPVKPHESRPSGSDKLFDGKVDDIVAKVIPAKWLPMSFVIAGALALIVFIFVLVGLLSSPDLEQAAKDEIAKVETARGKVKEALQKEQDAHRDTKKKLREADRAAGRAEKAEKGQKDADKELAELKTKYDTVRGERDDFEKKVKSAASDKKKALSRVERELSAALKKGKALTEDVGDLEAKIANYKAEIGSLEVDKEKDAQIEAVFKDVMETAARVEDLGKRLETLRTLRDRHASKFAGTDYAKRLTREIGRVEDERKDKSKGIYRAVERKLKMAKGNYDRQLEILRQAAEDLADTAYEDDVDAKIKKAEAAQAKSAAGQKTKNAKATFDAVMKRIKETPKAYQNNLDALKDAAQQTEGTKYVARLNKYVAARERTLAVDIAEAAYDGLRDRIKKNPEDFDGNITAAEAALAKAKGTKYEKKVQGILDDQRAERIYTIGKDAYAKARAKVKASSDRDENIAALEEFKATAAGSKYEAAIDKLLARERKYKEKGK